MQTPDNLRVPGDDDSTPSLGGHRKEDGDDPGLGGDAARHKLFEFYRNEPPASPLRERARAALYPMITKLVETQPFAKVIDALRTYGVSGEILSNDALLDRQQSFSLPEIKLLIETIDATDESIEKKDRLLNTKVMSERIASAQQDASLLPMAAEVQHRLAAIQERTAQRLGGAMESAVANPSRSAIWTLESELKAMKGEERLTDQDHSLLKNRLRTDIFDVSVAVELGAMRTSEGAWFRFRPSQQDQLSRWRFVAEGIKNGYGTENLKQRLRWAVEAYLFSSLEPVSQLTDDALTTTQLNGLADALRHLRNANFISVLFPERDIIKDFTDNVYSHGLRYFNRSVDKMIERVPNDPTKRDSYTRTQVRILDDAVGKAVNRGYLHGGAVVELTNKLYAGLGIPLRSETLPIWNQETDSDSNTGPDAQSNSEGRPSESFAEKLKRMLSG